MSRLSETTSDSKTKHAPISEQPPTDFVEVAVIPEMKLFGVKRSFRPAHNRFRMILVGGDWSIFPGNIPLTNEDLAGMALLLWSLK